MKKNVKKINEEIKRVKYFGICCVLYSNLYKITKLKFFSKLKHKAILNYLNKNLSEYLKDDIVNNHELIDDHSCIWVFWMQGFENAPELVKKCLNSIKSNCGNHPVIELTSENIEEYIDIPDFIKEKLNSKVISMACFSDFLRLSLLEKYGGVWMDATLFMTNEFDKDITNFSFYSIKGNSSTQLYVSECRWTAFFMASSKKNPFIIKCRELFLHYFEKNDLLIDYFLIDYILTVVYNRYTWAKREIDRIPNNNLNVYWLVNNLEKNFNQKEWTKITKNTYIFKLNHRLDISSFDNTSYYRKI